MILIGNALSLLVSLGPPLLSSTRLGIYGGASQVQCVMMVRIIMVCVECCKWQWPRNISANISVT